MTDNIDTSMVKLEKISTDTSVVEIEILPDLSVVKQEITTYEDEGIQLTAGAMTYTIVKEEHDVIDNAVLKTIFPDTAGVKQESLWITTQEKRIAKNEKTSSNNTEELLISPKREVPDTIDHADIDVNVLHEEVDLGVSVIDDEGDYKLPGLVDSVRIDNAKDIRTNLTQLGASPPENKLKLSKERKHIGKKNNEKNPNSEEVTWSVTGSEPSTSMLTDTHLSIRNSTTKRKEFICDKCNFKFTSNHSLTRHLKKKGKLYACHDCEYKTYQKGNLKTHFRTHTGEKPFVCDFCEFKCSRKGILKTHLTTHTGEKSYECNVCNFKCSVKGNLQTHLKTHTGEKLYACNACNYKCVFKSNLKRHIRTHTGEKPFACNACDHKYSDKASLQTHLRAHTGEKPYACNICNCKFSNDSNLRRHLKIHTGEKPYACNICEYKSLDKSHLQRHFRTHIQ